MTKALTELIRDANRNITPADRHAILDLIEQQADALEAANARISDLLTQLEQKELARYTLAMGYERASKRAAELEAQIGTKPQHWNPTYNTDPVQRACGELPNGWEIEIRLEKEAGSVYLIRPDGECIDFDNCDKFDWTIHEAIDAALANQKEG